MLVLTRTRGIIAAAVMVAALTLGRDGKLAVNSSPLGGPNYGDCAAPRRTSPHATRRRT